MPWFRSFLIARAFPHANLKLRAQDSRNGPASGIRVIEKEFRQDGPPKGGYKPINYKGIFPNRGAVCRVFSTFPLMPPDLFFGTGIQTCILVLKKSKKDNKVLFINAEREFARIGNKNKLRSADIDKILTKYTDRTDEEHFARLVDHAEIAEKDHALTVTNYVFAQDTREVVDIDVLNRAISEIVKRQSSLRNEIEKIVADLESGSR